MRCIGADKGRSSCKDEVYALSVAGCRVRTRHGVLSVLVGCPEGQQTESRSRALALNIDKMKCVCRSVGSSRGVSGAVPAQAWHILLCPIPAADPTKRRFQCKCFQCYITALWREALAALLGQGQHSWLQQSNTGSALAGRPWNQGPCGAVRASGLSPKACTAQASRGGCAGVRLA